MKGRWIDTQGEGNKCGCSHTDKSLGTFSLHQSRLHPYPHHPCRRPQNHLHRRRHSLHRRRHQPELTRGARRQVDHLQHRVPWPHQRPYRHQGDALLPSYPRPLAFPLVFVDIHRHHSPAAGRNSDVVAGTRVRLNSILLSPFPAVFPAGPYSFRFSPAHPHPDTMAGLPVHMGPCCVAHNLQVVAVDGSNCSLGPSHLPSISPPWRPPLPVTSSLVSHLRSYWRMDCYFQIPTFRSCRWDRCSQHWKKRGQRSQVVRRGVALHLQGRLHRWAFPIATVWCIC